KENMVGDSREHGIRLGVDGVERVLGGVEGGDEKFGGWKEWYDVGKKLDENGEPMKRIGSLGGELRHKGVDEEMGEGR
ncbi:hypothetical protein, partial [Paenibacillus xylanexedens]|uniref:hypothetical protein n=1 Tax=Paenibacillus xylanexedens TaxID=528191 RepID=UPI001C92CBE2